MDVSEVTRNLSSLGGAKWDMHVRARALAAAGHPIIELTIGEPDEPMAPALVPAMAQALQAGRVGYSNGRGEAALLDALAARYAAGAAGCSHLIISSPSPARRRRSTR